MSEELVLVFGLILATAAIGYLLIGQGGTSVMKNIILASDIADYATMAGFSGNDLVIAVAIALAESSGDANAVGDSGTSYGLWQIHYTVHPEVLNGADPSVLFDPQTNASAAFKVFEEQGFNAWSTYGNNPGHNNAYASYLDTATSAVNA